MPVGSRQVEARYGAPPQIDGKVFLHHLTNTFRHRSPMIDRLYQGLCETSVRPAVTVQTLPTADDFEAFAKRTKQRLFVLIHPSSNRNPQWASLAAHEGRSENLVDYAYSFRGEPAVNFTLIHGLGFSHPKLEELERIKGVSAAGAFMPLDIVLGGQKLLPHSPRPGNGRWESYLVASLPIRTAVTRGSNFVPTKEWPQGWHVYGVSNVTAEHMQQERNYVKERTPMTPEEILRWIDSYKQDIEHNLGRISNLQVPGWYPNIRDYQKAQEIADKRRQIESYRNVIARLQTHLNDPTKPIMPADLGIQMWH